MRHEYCPMTSKWHPSILTFKSKHPHYFDAMTRNQVMKGRQMFRWLNPKKEFSKQE